MFRHTLQGSDRLMRQTTRHPTDLGGVGCERLNDGAPHRQSMLAACHSVCCMRCTPKSCKLLVPRPAQHLTQQDPYCEDLKPPCQQKAALTLSVDFQVDSNLRRGLVPTAHPTMREETAHPWCQCGVP